MAIQSNASTEEVLKGIKTYSGLTNMNVIAVNPTMAELHALDINVKQEPNYYVEFNEESFFKVIFWLRNEDTAVRLEVLLTDKPRVSQTGKHQWINNVGQSTWSEENPTYDWWKTEGQRQAYTGEETLINFVKAWANVASGDNVSLDSIDSIVKGDVTEIKALVTALKENQVRVLVGVKDDRYQQVYTKYFGRIKPQRDDFFIKALNDDYGSFNADFNVDLIWGEHKPTVDLITPDGNGELKENEDWVEAGISDEEEDLPF